MLEGNGGIVMLGVSQATAVEPIWPVGIARVIGATGMAGCLTEAVGAGMRGGSVVRIAAVESAVWVPT